MTKLWYYVEGSERRGPVEEKDLKELFESEILNVSSLVWCKGMQNWQKVEEIAELASLTNTTQAQFSIAQIPDTVRSIFIRVGGDRGGVPSDYGPFDKAMLKRLYDEKRINGKTLVYYNGLKTWQVLADASDFEDFFHELPPVIEQSERRQSERKPFVARLFFANRKEVYEGLCRDISIGGMQVLIANFNGKAGDNISINVHPDNSDYHFVADGVVVRVLEGQQGFSFRFKNLSEESKLSIENYLKEN